jgi:hypothetical protein
LIDEFLKLSRTTMIPGRGAFSVGHMQRSRNSLPAWSVGRTPQSFFNGI